MSLSILILIKTIWVKLTFPCYSLFYVVMAKVYKGIMQWFGFSVAFCIALSVQVDMFLKLQARVE